MPFRFCFRTVWAALFLIATALFAPSISAQNNLFAPVVRVNDRVITQFELNQRELFFQLLNAPGDRQQMAFDRLVEERLQLDAAEAMGLVIEEAEVLAGMEEFAGRANMDAAQFITALEGAGVARETFEDFIRAGVIWRNVVRSRFGPRAQVSEDEIDRALAQGSAGGGVRVLISEIFLPANTAERRAAAEARAPEISRITSVSAFAEAARRHSAAPSRSRGGRQDWIPLGNLPPQIRGQILTLAPGEVTEPINLPNAIALFQLRDIQEVNSPNQEAVSVEFARYFIPLSGGRSAEDRAQAILQTIDTCDDLYGIAAGQPEDQLQREVLPLDKIAGDVAVELARLDENEAILLPSSDGQALTVLMLCGRTLAVSEEANRELVRRNLTNQRLEAYASGLLSEIRADAVIQRLAQ
jgi:peptidyl-prolyl cis-trans isomerase SurA